VGESKLSSSLAGVPAKPSIYCPEHHYTLVDCSNVLWIFEQVEQVAFKLLQAGLNAVRPFKFDRSLGPEEKLAMRRLGGIF